MNTLKIAVRDISKILKNKFIRISVTAIIIVPLLYSFLYLYAFWDPYSKLSDLPVAFVNLDKGTTKDGEQVNYGKEIVDNLKDNHKVGWTFVSKKEAEDGVKGSKYYAMFMIPEDFSQKIVSAKDSKPQVPSILYTANEKRNFLAAQINGKVVTELKAEIIKNITDEYTKVTFDNLYDLKDGMNKAADGSKELKNGIVTAADGSVDLKEGMKKLNEQIPTLVDGANKLYNGASELAQGVNTTSVDANGKPLGLRKGSKQLWDGLAEVKEKIAEANNQLSANKDLLSLLDKGNASALKQIMSDAAILQKNVDPALIGGISQVANPQMLALLEKASQDVKDSNITAMIDDPAVKSMIAALTPDNVQKLNALLKDTAALRSVDMSKLTPISSLLSYSSQLNSLMTQAGTLAALDMNRLAPMKDLLSASNQLSGLMQQAGALGKLDMSSIKALSPILTPQNAGTINDLLSAANSKFAGTQGIQVLNFLELQKKNGSDFITNAANAGLINPSTGIVQDTAILEKKLLGTDTAPLTPQEKTQLAAALSLVKSAAPQMMKAAPVIDGMHNDLSAFKDTLDNNQTLISGIQSGLTPNTIKNINTMLAELQAAQAKIQTPESIKALSTVQTALTPENINNTTAMLTTLQTAQEAMNSKEAVEAMKAVQTTLTPENIKYITNTLQQLTIMKGDLEKNAAGLQMVQGLLAKVQDPSMMKSLAKMKDLQADIEGAKPLLTMLNNLDATRLADAPKLLAQVNKLENELTDNAKLLDVIQNALNDGNIEMANQLIAAMPTLVDGINQLTDGAKKLSDGTIKVGDGANQLRDGLAALTGKVPELSVGTQKLYDGASKLNDGMGKLADGSKELNDKLTEGTDKLNENLVNDSKTMGKYVSEPVAIREDPVNPVKNYGTGFTPYFVPLSLWVGALLMFFVITDKVDDDIDASNTSLVLGKYLSYAYVGILQAVLLSTVVLLLGLRPNNVALYYLFNIFLSFVFIAIIQSLIFLLGDAGRLLAIILLIIQLTSSAGTFPLEIVPKFFKVMNPFVPFTYATSGLREIISGVDYTILGKDVTILACVMVVFLIISVGMKGHMDTIQQRVRAKKDGLDVA